MFDTNFTMTATMLDMSFAMMVDDHDIGRKLCNDGGQPQHST
jgi:hypothetical protein